MILAFFEFDPSRFASPLVIIGLVLAFLGFILAIASNRIAEQVLRKKEFESDEEKQGAIDSLGVKIKVLAVVLLLAGSFMALFGVGT